MYGDKLMFFFVTGVVETESTARETVLEKSLGFSHGWLLQFTRSFESALLGDRSSKLAMVRPLPSTDGVTPCPWSTSISAGPGRGSKMEQKHQLPP